MEKEDTKMKVLEFVSNIPYLLKGIGLKNILKGAVVWSFIMYIVTELGLLTILFMAFVLYKMFGKKEKN